MRFGWRPSRQDVHSGQPPSKSPNKSAPRPFNCTMATLGILINHYDARNDIRDLVSELSHVHKVVLLGPLGSVYPEHLAPGIEFRACERRRVLWRRILDQLYRHFGFIPRSKENFYITNLSKMERLSGIRRLLARASLSVRMRWPLRISPECYLRMLVGCDATPIDDIDGFLLITEFSDNALTARIVGSGKPSCAYVYSWDHPCKHAVMAKGIHRYAVWNSELARDMCELQGIPVESCVVVGATQLVPIHQAMPRLGPSCGGQVEGRPYFYYGCGVGPLAMARQEMEIVRRLAVAIRNSTPDHLLLVRPYPMSQDGGGLRSMLAGLDNVRWDDEFQSKQIGRSLESEDILRRIRLQRGAKAFFHVGTTMGFEGSFIGTPCVMLRPPAGSDPDARQFEKLAKFAAQYHLHRYLVGSANYIEVEPRKLEEALRRCAAGWPALLADNRRVAADTPVRSMSDIANHLARLSLG